MCEGDCHDTIRPSLLLYFTCSLMCVACVWLTRVCGSLVCHNFSSGLIQFRGDHAAQSPSAYPSLKQTLHSFSTAVLLYGQYISSLTEALSSLDKKAKKLRKYLKMNPIHMLELQPEQLLMAPQKQFEQYAYCFAKLSALDVNICDRELEMMRRSLDKIHVLVEKQATEIEVLEIQSKFIGNPPIFKADRKFILEGDLFRVVGAGKDMRDKQYKFHLFSDALIYSRILNEKSYKFTRALKLADVTLNDLPDLPNDLNTFEIVYEERTFKIRAHNASTKQAWISTIQFNLGLVQSRRGSTLSEPGAETVTVNERGEKVQNAAASAMSKSAKFVTDTLKDVNVGELGPRGKKVRRGTRYSERAARVSGESGRREWAARTTGSKRPA